MRAVLTFLFLLAATPLVAQSLTQNDIVQVQELLADMGYGDEVGTVDGIMGPATSTAIAAFQRETGVTATGEPSSELIAALLQLKGEGWDRSTVVATGLSIDCDQASTPTERAICSGARFMAVPNASGPGVRVVNIETGTVKFCFAESDSDAAGGYVASCIEEAK